MKKIMGLVWAAVPVLLSTFAASAQVPGNQSLTGKYYFRQVSLGTDGVNPGNLTDPRSLTGSISFDGSGHFSFTAQQLTGMTAAVAQTGSGAYAIDSGGFIVLDSPLRTGAKINARFGPEAVVGSSTESADNTFDLFVAIPAPASGAIFAGPYTAVSLEFPGGATPNMRASQFTLSQSTAGNLQPITVTGHAVNISRGQPQSQIVSGATYTVAPDGTGTLTAGSAANTQLLSGTRALYLSASGNILLGGSTVPGGHDILIAVKGITGASNATWNASFFGAGLRFDATGVLGYAGSLAARGQQKVTWSKRIKALGVGAFDFTGINGYTLNPDGTGTVDLTNVVLGASGKAFVGAAMSTADPGAYEIYFGVQVPARAGTGVFLDPLGVTSAASFAPAGNPIAPGEFIALFGSGLAKSLQTATVPYPKTLNGVTVTINGVAAPLYFVSAGQINCVVPYSITGPTASIIVQNGTNSNTVTVPVAATAPGVFTADQSGSGIGAMRHADATASIINASNPASPGETIQIYLTGMGAVNPSVADGTAGTITTLYQTISDVVVLVAGQPATVLFKGLAPGFPGLYQFNVTLPTFLGSTGNLPLAIQTLNAYHDQVDIPIH
ncbi:MAG: hypothetical protein JWP63_795 [Candidatus Solibacter sp.]|nr:hypothetical protein [Candidatus Solibacter sp.]